MAGIPTPIKSANSGDPRQAPTAILGNPFLAIDTLEMKSRRQFPQANNVIPMVGSDKLNAIPIALITDTTSVQIKYTHATAITNPRYAEYT